MDTVIADWLAYSPQRATDAGDDLACVDNWLNSDLGGGLGQDDIARSLEEFTGQEFFNDSPPPYTGQDTERAPLQQPSACSQPTSSGDGPSSSGGVCGDTSSAGMGHLSRAGAFRSFSMNDLQLLLEQQQQEANLLPPVTGLSAPSLQYGSHMGLGLAGARSRAQPALESVPEGAPSSCGAVLEPPPAIANHTSLMPVGGGTGGGAESGTGARSPAPGVLPGSGPAPFQSAPQQEVTAIAAAAAAAAASYQASTDDGSGFATPATLVDPAASAQPAGPLAPEASGSGGGGSLLGGTSSGGGLRPVPSTGTLAALMNNTLSFQREGTDESTQQQTLLQQAPLPPLQQQQQPQELRHAAEGAMLAAVGAMAGAAAPHLVPTPAGATPQAHYGSGAAAAAASAAAAATAAAAAGVYPLGAVPALVQPFALPQPAVLYGMAPPQPTPHLYSATPSFPPGTYALGLPMPLPPAHLLAGPTAGADDAASTAASAAAAPSPAGCEAAAHSAGAASSASSRGLRKSQSALELGSWRSTSLELPSDVAEAGTGVTGQKLIGRLTPEERLQRILRYRSKRNMRNFNREVKYQCRKTLADSRPRVGGRFARNDDPNSVLPHQTKKALRMRQGAASAPAGACAGAGGANTVTSDAHQQQAAREAPPPPLQPQQQQQPGAVKAASSSSTTSSRSGDNQAATYAVSSGAAVASASRPAPQQRHAVSVFSTACGLPFSCSMPGMPYTAHGLVSGALRHPAPPGPAPGALPHGIDAAALQHHYAVVNAAAQAAAQGVYAHLGMAAPPAASMPPLHIPGLAAAAFGAGPAPAAVAAPLVPLTAKAICADADAVGPAMPMAMPQEGVVSAAVSSRVDTPVLDSLWTHLEADTATQAAAHAAPPVPEALAAAAPAAPGGATRMLVDG